MTEKEEQLQTEVERLEEWIKEYKKWSKNDDEIHQRILKENRELTNKIIVDTVKASGVDLNNREETIIKIMTASLFKNEEMRRKVETAPKDKITLNVEKGGYQLTVNTIPSQTIGIYKTAEEIEEILKRLEIPKEETTATTPQAEEIKENKQSTANNEEQIQRNCEQIQELLQQSPNRKIGVLRIDIDRFQIREKGTKKVLYKGTSAETLQELEKQLGTLTEVNKRRILEIANTFPPNTIKVDIKDDWCYFHKTYSDLQYDTVFRISEFGGNTEDNLIRMSKDANEYYQEKIKNNQ